MKWTFARLIQMLIIYAVAVGCFVIPLYDTWSRQHAGWFVLLGIGVLIGAVYLQQMWANYEQKNQADEFINCLNMKRHDWLNHIQVMMGYVSLNKQDRLQAYVKRVVEDAEQESRINRIGYVPLTCDLLTRHMYNRQIVLDIHIVSEVTIKSDKQGKQLLNTIREIERLVHKTYGPLSNEDPPLRIGITLAAHDADIMLYVDFPDRSSALQRGIGKQDWTTVCKKVLSRNGEVFIEGEQSVLECTVRIS